MEKCNPTLACSRIAKETHKNAIKRCNKIKDPEKKNICIAEADAILKETLELCECKENAYDVMQPIFEKCETIADATERLVCLVGAQKELDALYRQCEEAQRDCYEVAEEYYVEFITEQCDALPNSDQ